MVLIFIFSFVDVELLSTYNFFMAAVAQTFAALVALTAVFFVYRLGSFEQSKRVAAEQMRNFFASTKSELSTPYDFLTPKLPFLEFQMILTELKSLSDKKMVLKIIELYKSDDPEEVECATNAIRPALEYLCYDVHAKEYRKRILRTILITSLTVGYAILTLPLGMFFLVSDRILPVLLFMVIAILAGGISLLFTIQVIWILLKGPQVADWTYKAQKGIGEDLEVEDLKAGSPFKTPLQRT